MGHRCKHLNKGSNLSPILINKQISPGKKSLQTNLIFFFSSEYASFLSLKQRGIFIFSVHLFTTVLLFIRDQIKERFFYEESEDSISLSLLTLKYLSDSKLVYIYFPFDYEIWLLRCIDFLFVSYLYLY